MKQLILLTLSSLLLISTAFAEPPSDINDDNGLWWNGMDQMKGSLVFSTSNGALTTLTELVQKSSSGQLISSTDASSLVKGSEASASVNLLALIKMALMKSKLDDSQKKAILNKYTQDHPNTDLMCQASNQLVLCFIKKD